MRRTSLIFSSLLLFVACQRQYVENPDPNHTHADFAVWIDGKEVDFSGDTYMSGLEDGDEGEHDHVHLHPYLHLHDHVGHVVHRHKGGLTLREFFNSLDFSFGRDHEWRMFINGEERDFDLEYVFEDMDQVLLTTSSDEQVEEELEHLTSDACLYSQTCPWKGDPPTENCIADPTVPCVAP